MHSEHVLTASYKAAEQLGGTASETTNKDLLRGAMPFFFKQSIIKQFLYNNCLAIL